MSNPASPKTTPETTPETFYALIDMGTVWAIYRSQAKAIAEAQSTNVIPEVVRVLAVKQPSGKYKIVGFA